MSRIGRKFLVLALILALGALLIAAPASAATLSGQPTVSLGCASFSAYFEFTADRDNSGEGGEFVDFYIYDGANNLVSSFLSAPLEPGNWYFDGANIPYDTAPQSNPLTFRLVSPAGNGLDEQVLFSNTSDCVEQPLSSQSTNCMYSYPPNAPQVRILQTTPGYFAPRMDAASDEILQGGTSWHVMEVNAEAGFTRLFIACNGSPLWVPNNLLG